MPFYQIISRQNYWKECAEECIFDYIALHFECQFNKNSLLQGYFLEFLLAGMREVLNSTPILNRPSCTKSSV